MSSVALRVDGLSKQYRIGARREPYGTLRESVVRACGAPFRLVRVGVSQKPMFWALRDVGLEVRPGEVLGVIGRNGAGKSTLLKILSRITEPTGGWAEIAGRVGSLLEVGTGFHAELSGRDNIYLNGAILGMKREEIARKFDEIVAFAEVEQFIDTPVKHYSSGMYLRLAFAVAAHLEPEILLIDEVLAVGDADFQKKCLGQMGRVAREGRTVLFVSHNMAAVRSLSTRVLYLDHGRVGYIGEPNVAIRRYQHSVASPEPVAGAGPIAFSDMRVNGSPAATISPGDPFEVTCRVHLRAGLAGFILFCTLQDGAGDQLAVVKTDHRQFLNVGTHNVTVRFPALWLRSGVYSLFFKTTASGVGTETKYVSDHVMLDVVGEHTGVRALLNPSVEWIAREVA